MQAYRNMFVFCLLVTIAAVSATTVHNTNTKTDDITAKCDDIIGDVLERLDYLEERDRLHAQTNAIQQEKIAKLEKQLEQQKLKKESLERQSRYSLDNPVAFYAKVSSIIYHLNQGQSIVFDQTQLNVGSHYNNSTGIFMAPYPGIYVFSVTLMTDGRTDTHAGIYVNGHMKTFIKLFGSEHLYDTMSQTAVYGLNQGDVVTVQHMEPDKSIHNDYSYFSGFLLYEDFSEPSNIVG